jgi:hypothetical protein
MTWCLRPARPSSPAGDWSRPRHERNPAGQQPAARKAATRAASARHPPRSNPAAASGRSCRNRSQAPAAGTPSGYRCTTRTGSRTAPYDCPAAYGPDVEDCPQRLAAAARYAPAARRESPTAWQRSSSSRLARTPFDQHQRGLTHRRSRQLRSLILLRVLRHWRVRRGSRGQRCDAGQRRERAGGGLRRAFPVSKTMTGMPTPSTGSSRYALNNGPGPSSNPPAPPGPGEILDAIADARCGRAGWGRPGIAGRLTPPKR